MRDDVRCKIWNIEFRRNFLNEVRYICDTDVSFNINLRISESSIEKKDNNEQVAIK